MKENNKNVLVIKYVKILRKLVFLLRKIIQGLCNNIASNSNPWVPDLNWHIPRTKERPEMNLHGKWGDNNLIYLIDDFQGKARLVYYFWQPWKFARTWWCLVPKVVTSLVSMACFVYQSGILVPTIGTSMSAVFFFCVLIKKANLNGRGCNELIILF